MSMTLEHHLRDRGLRVTQGRIAVLTALEGNPHSDADTLCQIVREQVPTISVQSVHNVLHDLTEAGMLRRIEPAGSSSRYERRLGDNHHHVVCTRCGAIEDVDCVHGEAPCLTPSNTAGFTIETAEVTFWGVCPRCASGGVIPSDASDVTGQVEASASEMATSTGDATGQVEASASEMATSTGDATGQAEASAPENALSHNSYSNESAQPKEHND
jgi:Fur family ferric uptake transcriptional regulator